MELAYRRIVYMIRVRAFGFEGVDEYQRKVVDRIDGYRGVWKKSNGMSVYGSKYPKKIKGILKDNWW